MSVILLLTGSGVQKSVFTYNSAVTKENRNLITGVLHRNMEHRFYPRWGVGGTHKVQGLFLQIAVMVGIWRVFDLM